MDAMDAWSDFSFSKAGDGDVAAVHALLQRLGQAMPSPDHFVVDTLEYVADHVDKYGFILLAKRGGMLAGFLIVDMPGGNEKNLAFDLGWPREMAEVSAHIDIAGVDPACRGLQRELTRRAEELLAAEGIKAFFSTVHPDNTPSLNNILAMGYRIGTTKRKYGGVLRHVLYKKVNTPQ